MVGAFLFNTSPNAASISSVNETAVQVQKDGEILDFLMTVDRNEIAITNLALEKQLTPDIKKYVQMLKQQHKQHFKQALNLSKKTGNSPIDSAAVISLQKNGARELAALTPLNGNAFDKAFIDAMVAGHTNVLNIINNDLLKNVSNPVLKKYILSTLPHIELHLQQGKMIQKELH